MTAAEFRSTEPLSLQGLPGRESHIVTLSESPFNIDILVDDDARGRRPPRFPSRCSTETPALDIGSGDWDGGIDGVEPSEPPRKA